MKSSKSHDPPPLPPLRLLDPDEAVPEAPPAAVTSCAGPPAE
jgi:hypothetical protein